MSRNDSNVLCHFCRCSRLFDPWCSSGWLTFDTSRCSRQIKLKLKWFPRQRVSAAENRTFLHSCTPVISQVCLVKRKWARVMFERREKEELCQWAVRSHPSKEDSAHSSTPPNFLATTSLKTRKATAGSLCHIAFMGFERPKGRCNARLQRILLASGICVFWNLKRPLRRRRIYAPTSVVGVKVANKIQRASKWLLFMHVEK